MFLLVQRDHPPTSMDWYVYRLSFPCEPRKKRRLIIILKVPTTWVTHVNSKPTPDLDAFLDAVGQVQDNTYVRIRTVSFDNVPIVVSVKTNNHYFPTSDLRRDDTSECGWSRHEIS